VDHRQVSRLSRRGMLVPLTPLFAGNVERRILNNVTVRGKTDFLPCDGCEHTDQLLITDENSRLTVNVLNLGMGRFYDPGCEGKIHPWLTQLFDLKVHLVFSGQLTSLTEDYWEGQFWTAATGSIYLDRLKTIELISFLEDIPTRLANSYGTSADRLWNVESNGRFTKFEMGILFFRYLDREVLLDTGSGTVFVRKLPN
jgi:hypothetical protein